MSIAPTTLGKSGVRVPIPALCIHLDESLLFSTPHQAFMVSTSVALYYPSHGGSLNSLNARRHYWRSTIDIERLICERHRVSDECVTRKLCAVNGDWRIKFAGALGWGGVAESVVKWRTARVNGKKTFKKNEYCEKKYNKFWLASQFNMRHMQYKIHKGCLNYLKCEQYKMEP